MKKLLLVCCLSASLFSCSLLQRHGGPDEETTEPQAPATESPAADSGPLFTPNGQEASGGESEVSRLNTKIAALETKVDVLSASLERMQAQKSQPVIQAEPQANLAAPVDEPGAGSLAETHDQLRSKEVSAAPARPARHLPSTAKETGTLGSAEPDTVSPKASTAAEREFRAGMELFQNGQNLEASSRFALMAKKFPHHMLAAHALYWAGEAAARAQQWSIAAEDWSELEKRYPRSAYLPEALAGLAKAYDAQGDATKAKLYRTMVQRAFPKSPVAMKSGTEQPIAEPSPMGPPAKRLSRATGAGTPAAESAEESAPLFEEDNGAAPSPDGAGAETQ